MFPAYDPTLEQLTLKLIALQRVGKLDQVELCEALREEYRRGWKARSDLLQMRLQRLPRGLRGLALHWVQQSPGESPQAGPHLDALQSPPHCRQR